MQRIGVDILDLAKKEKMKKLETTLKGVSAGEVILCPSCNYSSPKNRRGSAKIFDNGTKGKALKCFSCGIWRRLE